MIRNRAAQINYFKKPGFVEAHFIIWRNGGPWERFFLIAGVFTYIFLPTAAAFIAWLVLDGAVPYAVLFSYVLAATTYGAFHETFSSALFNAKSYRQFIDEGRVHPHEDYYREYVRFLEQETKRGLFPGAVGWSLAFWTLYYGMMLIAIPFTLAFPPHLRIVAPLAYAALDAAVVLPCWLSWQLHRRGISREMDRKGYRLSELARAAGWMAQPRPRTP